MYADTGLLYHPYYQNFSQDAHHLDLLQLCHSQQSHSSMSSTISDYDLGGEGDLFKAPEAIMEEPIVSIDPILDPMTAAISMMSCADHVMPTQELNLGALGSLPNDQLFGEISYECKKNILGSTSTESHLSEVMDIRLPAIASEMQTEEKLITESMFQKSVSSECLSSMDWINANTLKPSFLDFSDLDLGAVYGMRRAFSEGDIKALSNGNVSFIHSSIQQRPPVIGSCTSEDRLQKLSRYRNKKSKRNFGRKIKYACRKALADSQPRIRGRFAKTEETELLKRH